MKRLRDVEDGYPLGLISRDRQFESDSRNKYHKHAKKVEG